MFSYSIVMLINYAGALKYRVDGPEDTVRRELGRKLT